MADQETKGLGMGIVHTGSPPSLSVDVGGANPHAEEHADAGFGIDPEAGTTFTDGDREEGDHEGEDGQDPEGAGGEDGEGDGGSAEAEGDGTGGTSEAVPDLGEYKAEDQAKWDAHYKAADGNFDLGKLSAEWWGNRAKAGDDGDGSLNEGTYAYLQKTMGLSKSDVQDIEAAVKIKSEHEAATIKGAVYEKAGGAAVVEAALAWGKGGGYTREQRQRFNSIMQSGDLDAIQDAVDAAVVRHQRAGAPPPKQERSGAVPKRDATAGASVAGGGEAGETFASFEDYQGAVKAARKVRDADRQMAEIRAKLARSPFYKAQQRAKQKGNR